MIPFGPSLKLIEQLNIYVPPTPDTTWKSIYKVAPPDEPKFYLFIGEVVHSHVKSFKNDSHYLEDRLRSNIEEHIRTKYPQARVLDESQVGPWKFFLIENEGRYNVFFPGTTKWLSREGVDNIRDHLYPDLCTPTLDERTRIGLFALTDRDFKAAMDSVIPPVLSHEQLVEMSKQPYPHVNEMGQIIRRWESERGMNVTAAFAYSGTAKYVHQIEFGHNVWRITLNGETVYKKDPNDPTAPYRIDFAEHGELLTHNNGTQEYCFILPKSRENDTRIDSHSILGSWEKVAEKSWSDFMPDFSPSAQSSSSSDPIPTLIDRLSEDRLLEAKEVMPPVKEFFDAHKAEENLAKEIEEKSISKAEITAQVLKTAEGIAKEVYSLLESNDARRIKCSEYKEFYADYKKHREAQREEIEARGMLFSYSVTDIRDHIYNRLSPKGIFEILQEAQRFSVEYQEEMKQINDSIATNTTLRDAINKTHNFNDELALRNNARWKKALKAQQKLGEKIGLARSILAIAGLVAAGVAACLPGGQAVGFTIAAASANVLAQGGQFAQRAVDKKTDKINTKFEKISQESSSRSDRLHQTDLTAQDQGFYLRQRQFQQQEELRYCGAVFDAKTFCRLMVESEKTQKEQLEETTKKLEQEQNQFSRSNSAAEADGKRIQIIEDIMGGRSPVIPTGFKVIPEFDKKGRIISVRVDGCSKEQLEQNRAGHETAASSAGVNVESLKRQKQEQEVALKNTQEESKKAADLRPLTEFTESLYVKAGMMKFNPNTGEQVPVLSENEQIQKDRRDKFANGVQNIIGLKEVEYQVYTESLQVAKDYALFLSNCTGSSVPLLLHTAGSDFLNIKKQRAIWEEIYALVKKFAGSYFNEGLVPALKALNTTVPGEMSNLTSLSLLGASNVLPYVRLMFVLGSLSYKAYFYLSQVPQKEEIQEEIDIYLKSIQDSTRFLHSFLKDQFKDLKDHLDEQHRAIYDLINTSQLEILREVQEGNQKVINHVVDAAYNDYILRLYDIESQIKRKLSSEKGADYLKLLSFSFKESTSPLQTGIIPGNSLQTKGKHDYPAIDLQNAYRNPEHLTGLLFNQFNIHGIPNLKLLESLTGSFTEFIDSLSAPEYAALKDQINEIHKEMHAAFIRIEKSFQGIGQAIGQVCGQQEKILKEIQNRRIRVQNAKNAYVLEELKVALHNFEEQRRLLTEPVGYGKFFLYEEFVNTELSSRLSRLDVRKLQFEKSHTIDKMAIYASEAFETSVRLTFVTGFALFGLPFVVTNSLSVGIQKATNVYKSSVLTLFDVPTGYEMFQFLLDRKARSNLRTLANIKPHIIKKRPAQQEKFFLDLSSRKIKAASSNRHENEDPLLDCAVCVPRPYNSEGDLPDIHIQFDKDSPINPNDLDKIPNPIHPYRTSMNRESYDLKVKNLINEYLAFLDHKIGGVSIVNCNDIAEKLEKSQTVTSTNPNLIPLAFPKKLLEALEEKLAFEINSIEGLGAGSLIPAYDFSMKNGTWVISICYRFCPTHGGEIKKFCHFDVAHFDSTTVKAFQKNLLSDEQQPPNEFLLQAMYGNFYGLGMPCEKTYILPSGLVAPSETYFEGLYNIWMRSPETLVKFNYQIDTIGSKQNLTSDSHAGPILDKHYLDVMRILREKKKTLSEDETKYKNDYFSLVGLFKLVSGIDNRTLNENMVSKLGLFPPKQQDMLLQLPLKQNISNISEGHIKEFVKVLESKPNTLLASLRNNMERLNRPKNYVRQC